MTEKTWLNSLFYALVIFLLSVLFMVNLPSLKTTQQNHQLDNWQLIRRIPNHFNAAVDSNSKLRDFLIRAKHDFQYKYLGEKRFPIVLGGKDGWLYYTGERNMDDYQNAFPISEDELMQIYVNLEGLNRRLAARGKLLLVVIAPSRETIYPEWLPSGTQKVGDNDRLDALMAYMEQYGGKTRIIDMREVLWEAKKDHPLLYFKTDTHWNQYGAFFAYQEICKTIQASPGYEDFICKGWDDYTIEYIPYSGDMVKLMPTNLTIEEMVPNFVPKFESFVVQDPPLPYERDRIEWVTTEIIPAIEAPNPYKLVSWRDSFSMDLIPFIREDFQEAVYEWNFHYNHELRVKEDPDIVIIQVVERYLHVLTLFK
jgi:hypothetical protein